jgi:Arc/MetJ family transcription regulator
MQQQTTLTINDNLFVQAAQLTSIQDKNQLVELALTELIKNHQSRKKDVRDLIGKVQIAPDYDYKKLRICE